MSKSKSLTELITDLQTENEELSFLHKLFEQAIRHEFGMSIKELHQTIYKLNALEAKQTVESSQKTLQEGVTRVNRVRPTEGRSETDTLVDPARFSGDTSPLS